MNAQTQTQPAMTKSLRKLVDAVKSHANKHYGTEGWDIVVETASDEDIAAYITEAGATTQKKAIAAVGDAVNGVAQVRDDVIAAGGGDDEAPSDDVDDVQPEAVAKPRRATTGDAYGVLDALMDSQDAARDFLNGLPEHVRHPAIKKAMSKTMAKGGMHAAFASLLEEFPNVASPRSGGGGGSRRMRIRSGKGGAYMHVRVPSEFGEAKGDFEAVFMTADEARALLDGAGAELVCVVRRG